MKRDLAWDGIPSPFGDMVGVVDETGALLSLSFGPDAVAAAERRGAQWQAARLVEVRRQLGSYLAGELRRFSLPLAAPGTPFQREVWAALCEIPYGETRSYGELARALGQPGAARAVGRANATNPIGLVVPCHRVIGADGSLTGYAAGLPRKQALLRFEQAHQPYLTGTLPLFPED
ncbi:methylated-DNA--[protein]-cysteine S-methyltransferase [Chitinimonas arctica]|uniref:Methylated-DNA--protein-cysteine methyltransferase n=1 Tax=Chitinimonas arctica TaxID=2594795 RepID=A0A516SF70_9NEIS|nr:methylated-DNA--[protein]-cysteine S-methyltransferase [Chitinimonas arctica]QDQ26804.1 methylated-DNA--[protein]-cysteine S-methyltransferase [Chitinimonas arctica]